MYKGVVTVDTAGIPLALGSNRKFVTIEIEPGIYAYEPNCQIPKPHHDDVFGWDSHSSSAPDHYHQVLDGCPVGDGLDECPDPFSARVLTIRGRLPTSFWALGLPITQSPVSGCRAASRKPHGTFSSPDLL